MVKALMPISVGLESSIALRYAKQLSGWIDLRIHDIHVLEADRSGPMPAAQGWVRQKWEKALTESAEKEIREFLAMENLDLKRTQGPRVVRGKRSAKLLEMLVTGAYQLFIEGALPTFDHSGFYSLLSSEIYQKMPCPALVVKNPVSLDQAAILMEPEDQQVPVSAYLKVFEGSAIPTDIIVYINSDSDQLSILDGANLPAWVSELAKIMENKSVSVGNTLLIKASAPVIADYLRSYGLVAASVSRRAARPELKTEVLARLSTPVLICWSEISS
jgi:hypothetical protein